MNSTSPPLRSLATTLPLRPAHRLLYCQPRRRGHRGGMISSQICRPSQRYPRSARSSPRRRRHNAAAAAAPPPSGLAGTASRLPTILSFASAYAYLSVACRLWRQSVERTRRRSVLAGVVEVQRVEAPGNQVLNLLADSAHDPGAVARDAKAR